jgi:putative molybdenum carrier protein
MGGRAQPGGGRAQPGGGRAQSRPARIVSGGQTGVDRAALEAGRRAGIPIGGWCPLGGWAEDLPEPPGLLALYPELEPTASPDPDVRTRWNVRDSDATLVLDRADADSPGTSLTIEAAAELGRHYLMADVRDHDLVRAWLADLPAGVVLNVAGPRESEAPGITREAGVLLDAVLAED